MPQQKRDKIEYEFDDLRRNTDPVPNVVLAQLGIDNDGGDGRHEGKKRREAARRKERGESDGSDDDRDDRDLLDDDDLDADDEVTLSRKELSRKLTDTRRQAERKARQEIQEARGEAADVIGKLTKRVDGIERKGNQTEIDAEFGPKIADIEQQIETAMEASDTKKVIALNKQLAELTADRKIKIHQAAQTKKGDDADDDEESRRAAVAAKVPKRAQKWINRQDWFDDPEYAHVKAYLHKVDRDLLADDFDPDDDDYWVRLERKLEKAFPGVITPTAKKRRAKNDDDDEDDDDRDRSRRKDDDDEDDDDDRSDRNRRRQREAADRSPVSEGDRGGASRDRDRSRSRRNGEVTLSKAQLANMRAFGLDPDNKAHVEEYMLEVKRQDRAERR